MTGPEHYRQAERLLSSAAELELAGASIVANGPGSLADNARDRAYGRAARTTAAAQAHATLALATAAYDGLADNGGVAHFGAHETDPDALAALEGEVSPA